MGDARIKFNLYPWFDRNDLSHVLLIIGVSIYFVGVKKLSYVLLPKCKI
ncbi:MAG: DUF6962 family protein [Bacteroidota bacterium]